MFEIRQCILTNNDCYKENRKITPKGIVVHSTGANNTTLRRYLAPDDGIIGKNAYNNHWNRSGTGACVHAFIGTDKYNVVRCYQTLPFTMRPWGCGAGSKGSYNNSHIQFEICEDALNNEKYFNEAMKCAIEFCAYLVKAYKIDISNIVSHHEAYLLGYGSGHADCDHWLKRFGKDMNWFRAQVKLAVEKGEIDVTVPTPVKPEEPVTQDVVYTVSKGDTLTKIANMYNTTIDHILELNGPEGTKTQHKKMTRSHIEIGWKLYI